MELKEIKWKKELFYCNSTCNHKTCPNLFSLTGIFLDFDKSFSIKNFYIDNRRNIPLIHCENEVYLHILYRNGDFSMPYKQFTYSSLEEAKKAAEQICFKWIADKYFVAPTTRKVLIEKKKVKSSSIRRKQKPRLIEVEGLYDEDDMYLSI